MLLQFQVAGRIGLHGHVVIELTFTIELFIVSVPPGNVGVTPSTAMKLSVKALMSGYDVKYFWCNSYVAMENL